METFSDEKKKGSAKYLAGFVAIAILFFFVSAAVSQNEDALKTFIYRHEFWGAVAYMALGVTATVVAPLSSLPFLPLVSSLFGWFWAALFSIAAWSIGSFIAFLIARRYGREAVRRFVSLERVERMEARIPKDHIFWYVIFLRVVIPVDVLSYALGLFSTIQTAPYMLATVLGITPFAFIWAYFGGMSPLRLLATVVTVLAFYAVFVAMKRIWNQ